METTLTKWKQSNYEIRITASAQDMEKFKNKALQAFQKDMTEPGFRKWHVPLDIVEKKINPAYLEMGILEEIVHQGVKKVIDENKDIKFIGNIYDLNKEE